MSRGKKLPSGLQLPVKPGTISAVIRAANTAVEIDVSIHKHQEYWKEDRDRRTQQGDFRLLQCWYNPEPSFLKDGPSVLVWLYAVPVDLWRSSGPRAEHVVHLVEDHVADVCKQRAWNMGWRLELNWSSRLRQLELCSVIHQKQANEKVLTRTIKIEDERPWNASCEKTIVTMKPKAR